MSKRKTNIEFVTNLMDFSNCGALMQAFVMTALERYAEDVIENPIRDGGFISSEAWTRCAEEVKAELNNHLGSQS